MPARICTPVKEGVQLRIRLTPNSSRDAVDGVGVHPQGDLVLARVRQVPDKGKANQALIDLIAKELEWPKSSISLAFGSTSRLKTLLIIGDARELETRVQAWLKRYT